MTYQGFDRSWRSWGRVVETQVVGPHFMLKLHSGKKIQVVYQQSYEAIQLNDWVAVDVQNRLVRVTPSHRSPLKISYSMETLQKWNQFLMAIRSFFLHKNFLELQTPSLVVCPGTEPTLESFETTLKLGSSSEKRFLPTSPELHLKKALTLGFDRIFEVAKCYRNAEVTDLHQPEFWMLEWYRSFANLFDIEKDCVELIHFCADHLQVERPQGVECVSIPWLFKKYLQVEITPSTSRDEYYQIAKSQGLNVRDDYSIDDLFFLLMLEKIEPQLNPEKLTFVEKYPPFQAALARKDEKGWSERFEVYWKKMELANAFDELNDPKEQKQRASEDLQKREGRNPIALDEEFFMALESGMPPSAGIALGLERLFMALTGIQKIQDLRLFPIRRD